MSYSLISFPLFYFIIISSTIGYGYLLVSLTKIDRNSFNHGYLGLAGIFLLIIFSYISHYFFSHNYFFNSIILFTGLISFIYFFVYEKNKGELLKLNLLFLIIFISFVLYKSHDDFSYYHFPYTYHLTQNNLFIGIGNFNHGFRTPSSIFYLNSLFYLPVVKYYFFHIGAIMIFGFVNFIFLSFIQKKIHNKDYNNIFFLSLLSFLFVTIFFYRISEHGTDRSAQILIFLFIIEIIIILNFNKNLRENLSKIFIILGLVISLKAFYILYLSFLIPVLYFFIKEGRINYTFQIFKNYFFYLFLLLFFNILLVNFFNSGCFIYPLSITCFENYSWAIPLSEVSSMNDWYEQWAKAGANPNFRVENPNLYIQKFNWVGNWFDMYFFTKVSDFILGIIFLLFIISFVFWSRKKKYLENKKGSVFILIIIFFLLLEWFYNHPALRYGGYPLICLFLFLPISNFLGSRIHVKNLRIKTYVVVLLGFIIFFSRNIDRIIDEKDKYDFNVFQDISYLIEDKYFTFDKEIKRILNNKINCDLKKEDCSTDIKIDVKINNGYYIFYRKSL